MLATALFSKGVANCRRGIRIEEHAGGRREVEERNIRKKTREEVQV